MRVVWFQDKSCVIRVGHVAHLENDVVGKGVLVAAYHILSLTLSQLHWFVRRLEERTNVWQLLDLRQLLWRWVVVGEELWLLTRLHITGFHTGFLLGGEQRPIKIGGCGGLPQIFLGNVWSEIWRFLCFKTIGLVLNCFFTGLTHCTTLFYLTWKIKPLIVASSAWSHWLA